MSRLLCLQRETYSAPGDDIGRIAELLAHARQKVEVKATGLGERTFYVFPTFEACLVNANGTCTLDLYAKDRTGEYDEFCQRLGAERIESGDALVPSLRWTKYHR